MSKTVKYIHFATKENKLHWLKMEHSFIGKECNTFITKQTNKHAHRCIIHKEELGI